jgi:hypothetical protein
MAEEILNTLMIKIAQIEKELKQVNRFSVMIGFSFPLLMILVVVALRIFAVK